MPSKNPVLLAWDSCCILGLFNREPDKIAGLIYELRECDEGRAYLGIASATMSEITRLADGSPAYPTLEAFLQLPFIQQLNSTRKVGLLSSRLGHRFDLREQPELFARRRRSAVQPTRRGLSQKTQNPGDSNVYKAAQLTTYDPFLRFIGVEFVQSQFRLVVDRPASEMLFPASD